MVAEGKDGERLCFIRLESGTDHFTGEKRGYISGIAVAENGEGRGVGRTLMGAGEAWARPRVPATHPRRLRGEHSGEVVLPEPRLRRGLAEHGQGTLTPGASRTSRAIVFGAPCLRGGR